MGRIEAHACRPRNRARAYAIVCVSEPALSVVEERDADVTRLLARRIAGLLNSKRCALNCPVRRCFSVTIAIRKVCRRPAASDSMLAMSGDVSSGSASSGTSLLFWGPNDQCGRQCITAVQKFTQVVSNERVNDDAHK